MTLSPLEKFRRYREKYAPNKWARRQMSKFGRLLRKPSEYHMTEKEFAKTRPSGDRLKDILKHNDRYSTMRVHLWAKKMYNLVNEYEYLLDLEEIDDANELNRGDDRDDGN